MDVVCNRVCNGRIKLGRMGSYYAKPLFSDPLKCRLELLFAIAENATPSWYLEQVLRENGSAPSRLLPDEMPPDEV